MKDNKKITILILVLVLTITVVLGGTLAYWQWATGIEQQTLVNVSLTDDAKMYIDFPSNTLKNMYPTSDCDPNGISSWVTEITVDNGTGVLLSPSFKLKVKIEDKNGNIITNVTNTGNSNPNRHYIKFAVTGENELCQNALYTGRFDENAQTVNGNADWYDSELITLYDETTNFPIVSGKNGSGVSFYAYPNTQTKQKFKVYIWLDKDYVSVTQGTTSTDTMQDAKVTVSWSENSGLEQVKKAAPVGEAIAIYSEGDRSLRFYRETNPSSVTVGSTYNGRAVTNVFTGFENTSYNPGNVPWGQLKSTIESVVFEDYIYPTSTASWFQGFGNMSSIVTSIDVTKLDTLNVTNMSSMFAFFDGNIIGIENWDTSNVTDMSYMFEEVYLLDLDLSSWNVCNVTESRDFNYTDPHDESLIAPNFGHPKLCDGKIKGKAYMVYSLDDRSVRFYRSSTPITKGSSYNGRTVTFVYTDFETSTRKTWPSELFDSVGEDGYAVSELVFEDYIYPLSTVSWFQGFGSMSSIDVTKLDVSNVTDMSSMFEYAYLTGELDLSHFDTSNVTNMERMFYSAKINGTLDLSDWNVCKKPENDSFADVSSGTIIEPNWGMAC